MSNQDRVCHRKLAEKNGNNMDMRKDKLYELRRELNKSKISYLGLVSNSFVNMPCALSASLALE